MAHSTTGKIFYGGGDLLLAFIFLTNSASIGGFSGTLGMFLLARSVLTFLGIS